jgi:hypothetical protein
MADQYARFQNTADRLLTKWKQGKVILKRVTTSPPPNEWTPGEETETRYDLSATVKRLHQRYENGVLIIETGDMVTFAVPEVAPGLTDMLIVDGVERVITNLTKIPSAGTVVVYKAWCAA